MSDEKIYALITGGVVANIVLWNGVVLNEDDDEPKKGWSPPAGTVAVECPAEVGIGWSYENGDWIEPQPVAEPE